MISNSNNYFNKMVDILTPYIGYIMSQGAINAQCKRIGILPESITKNDIVSLAEGMQKALTVFVGSDGARTLTDKIQKIV
jgi:hypothetical protein